MGKRRLEPAAVTFAAALALAVVFVLAGRPQWLYANAWLHASLEGFSQLIGLIIAALALGMFYYEGWRRDLLVGIGFLAAALFDLPHSLTYPGVLPHVALRQDVSAYFWLAGRLALAGLLLASALTRGRAGGNPRARSRTLIGSLVLTMATVALLSMLLLCLQAVLPTLVGASGWVRVHLPEILGGHALTPLKVALEAVAAGTFLATLLLYRVQYLRTGDSFAGWLMLVLVPMVYSELFFMVYPQVYGTTWYMGHLLKIMAYLVLAVWLPVASMRLQAALSRERDDLLNAYREIGELLTAKTDLDALLRVVLSAAVRMTHAQSGLVQLADGQVLCTAGCGEPCPQGTCAGMVKGVLTDGAGPLQVRLDENRVTATVLLAAESERLGAICIWRSAQDPFTNEELSVLIPFASQAAVAVHQARLHRQRLEDQERREQFLAIATHEIKTPITSIKGYAQHIAHVLAGHQSVLPPGLLDNAATISSQADRMSRLVDEIMDWNRLRGGMLTLHRSPVMLNVWLPEALSLLVPAHPGRLIEHALPQEGLGVEADQDRLTQVLANLVANAVNYSPEDTPVLVRLLARGQDAVIEVVDQGRGVSADEMDTIFRPFYRAESSKDYYRQGIGLGLHVSREIIRQHGGDIIVSSRPGEGSVFSVILPLAPTSGA